LLLLLLLARFGPSMASVRYNRGVGVNKADSNGATALFVAAHEGNFEVVQLLLSCKDVAVDQADSEGATPLYAASRQGNDDIVRLLLARSDVNVNQAAHDGSTPLFSAVHNGRVAIVRQLLGHDKTAFQQARTDGVTPLMFAMSPLVEQRDVARLLVGHAALQEVRRVAREAVALLPADLLRDLRPERLELAAAAAALHLPLYAAAALGDTEDERAAADELASAIDAHKRASKLLSDADAAAPEAAAAAREAMALSGLLPAGSGAAADERELDALAAAAATTADALRAEHERRNAVLRAALAGLGRLLEATIGLDHALRFVEQHIAAYELKCAERLTKFVLRRNGRSSQDRLRGPSRELATAIEQLISERDDAAGQRERSRAEATFTHSPWVQLQAVAARKIKYAHPREAASEYGT
jgi:hypothetical protein